MPTPNTLNTSSRTGLSPTQRILAAILAFALVALAGPANGYAQETMNAQPLTSEGIALTASELGPEWSLVARHSQTFESGTRLASTEYSAPSGRTVRLTTAVATSSDFADAVINYLRYQLESDGLAVSSVQANGFGDGRAFKAQLTRGDLLGIVYLFRVRNLMAFASYTGSASAGDVPTQAINVARKQEAKLFAAFAPPPAPTPLPTMAPTPVPTTGPATGTAAPSPSTPDSTITAAAPHCQPSETPRFRLGFAALSAALGARMGNPMSCEYSDPAGSGDTLQATDTGLAIYRAGSGTATFTNGSDHWALARGQLVHWTGNGLDPPDEVDQLPE